MKNPLCKVSGRHVIHWKILILKEGNDVLHVTIVLNDLAQAPRHLIIRRATSLNEDRVGHVEMPGPRFVVVRLLINKDDQMVAKTINLLVRRFEWARRLGLPDACGLDVHTEIWDVDAAGRVTFAKCVFRPEAVHKLALKVGSHSFTIRDSIEGRLIAIALNLSEHRRLPTELLDSQWYLAGQLAGRHKMQS